MGQTPNYSLATFQSQDMTQRFIEYRTAMAGDTQSSNMYKIDQAMKNMQDAISDLQSKGQIPEVIASYQDVGYYTATQPSIQDYVNGMVIQLQLDEENAGDTSININNIGTVQIRYIDNSGNLVSLYDGLMKKNNIYFCLYDGSYWVLCQQASSSTQYNVQDAINGNNIQDIFEQDGTTVKNQTNQQLSQNQQQLNGKQSEEFATSLQGNKADTAVQSVNGKSGNQITLSPNDIGAAPQGDYVTQEQFEDKSGFRNFFNSVYPDGQNKTLDPSRPMQSAAAASVTATSRGDFIHSVTVNGFTEQAGSGDASPTNVRALTNGGLKFAALVLTGDETFFAAGAVGQNGFYCFLNIANANTGAIQKDAVCSHFKNQIYGFDVSTCDRNVGNFFVGKASTPRFVFSHQQLGTTPSTSVDACITAVKAYCAKEYEKGTPITVWYATADGTGFLYAPIHIQGGEYRANCLPLTAPLCAGDSVVSWVKSGCDQQLALDGSTLTVAASGSNYTVVAANAVAGGTVYASGLAGLSLTAGSVTIPGTAFPSSVTNAKQANTWLQGNPQTLYYRSIAYAEAADISVSLESHAQAVLVLDGTEPGSINPGGGYISIPLSASAMPFMAQGGANSGISSIAKMQYASAGSGFYWVTNSRNLIFGKAYADQFDNYAAFQAKMAGLYSAGTPAQFVYPLSTPTVYAHPAVDIVAVPDDTGSYTVSSQDGTTVSVALGGFASEAQGKKADTAVQTVNGQQGPSVTLSPQDVGGISTYTCTTAGTTHALTGSGDNIKFVADTSYTDGDTITVNGTTVTAQTQSGAALVTGAWASGATVVCLLNGTTLTVGNAYTPPVYSSVETLTGEKWINGKPIYRKCWEISSPSIGNTNIPKTVEIQSPIKYGGTIVLSRGDEWPIPVFLNNESGEFYFIVSTFGLYESDQFILQVGSGFTGETAISNAVVWIEYTKP